MVYTHSDGNFSFPLFSNFGNEEIFYRISYKGKRLTDSQITVHDYPVNTEVIKGTHSDTLNAYGLYAKQKQFIDKSYQYFVSREKVNMLENVLVSEVETDSEILLEKFESFSSMAEVFSNIAQSVRYKKRDDGEQIRIFLKSNAQFGMNDPLYIVDGIMTDDTHYILSLDPKLVKRIGVLRSQETLARFGDLGLDGILVIDTNNPTTRESTRHSGNSLSLIGISKTVAYKKVTYNQNRINSRVPDLRSSLYWNPKADLSKIESFDFYTGDDIGYYIIQLAGLLDGKPFLSTKRFYVSQRVDQ
jgi:hypothetical protein